MREMVIRASLSPMLFQACARRRLIAIRVAADLGKCIGELKLEIASSFASAWCLHVDGCVSTRLAVALRALESAFPAWQDSEERKKAAQKSARTVDSFSAELSQTRDHVYSSKTVLRFAWFKTPAPSLCKTRMDHWRRHEILFSVRERHRKDETLRAIKHCERGTLCGSGSSVISCLRWGKPAHKR